MIVPGLRCTICGEAQLVAIWPGTTGDQMDLFALTPQRPVKAWCEPCWAKLFGKVEQQEGRHKREPVHASHAP